ncbi:MAG TPA: SDR family NAD(P)-dependent oxidoreductase [Streptosporangiaceae bacterium]|nr:SDR family NAD(P)-dependent oxidoreductase [Streptosporangiaceae bacterium]
MTDVAFVTGAAGGIGQAICASLTRAGFTVYGGDLSVAAERADGAVVLGPLDVRSSDSVETAVAGAAKLGSITAVVNCAGIVRHTPLDDLNEADVDAVWDVNVAGAARVCRAAVPHMPDGAAIVNIGSVTARSGRLRGASAYGASKAGVEALTRYLAVELAPRIRVNAVVPGYINVPMSPSMRAVSGGEDRLSEMVALGRLGETSEVADAVEYLLSPRSSYITGSSLLVDGGLLAW